MTLFGVASFKLCNGFISGGGADGGVGTAVLPNLRLGRGVVRRSVAVVAVVIDVVEVAAAVVEVDTVDVVAVVFSSLGFRDGTDEKYDNCIPDRVSRCGCDRCGT